MRRNNKKKSRKIIVIIGVLLVLIFLPLLLYKKIPDYYLREAKNKTNLVINNNNVTRKMKNDLYIDNNEIIYLSIDDLKNYFDKYVDYDEKEGRLITTSDKKVATIFKDVNNIDINGSNVKINASIIEKNGKIYIPFSELAKNVYNTDISYIKSSDRVVIDSLDREFKKADISKSTKVKYKEKKLSKTVDKVKKGDKVVLISQSDNWAKIRTEKGIVGYISNDYLTNIVNIRGEAEEVKHIDEKVNLVWDYYSEYAQVPDRSKEKMEGVNVVSPSFFYIEKGSKGEVSDNANVNGKKYIQWAHDNGYKVWAMVSNNSYLTTTEDILNDFEKRTRLINEIVNLSQKYDVDGINLDFENMNKEDKELFSRLAIELSPRLNDIGKALTIDVTAPDGAETWSLCFDRKVLADVSDYLIFMGYDQYGSAGTREGTTAGYNWVSNNVNKFLNQEEVSKDKLILGIPLYTRLWKEQNGETTSKIVNMADVDSTLPENIDKKWDDKLKQNYVEYSDKNAIYKMWIEDEESMKERLNLVKSNDLAGIAFWEKDREPSGFWEFVNQEYNN